MYSTCSILPLENDDVVSTVLASWEGDGAITVTHPLMADSKDRNCQTSKLDVQSLAQMLGAEQTELGMLILPDCADAGPMYICVLCKQHSNVRSE